MTRYRILIFAIVAVGLATITSCRRLSRLGGRESAPEPQVVTTLPAPVPETPTAVDSTDVVELDASAAGTLSEAAERELLQSIFFDYDSAEIRPDAAATLDTKVRWLRENPRVRLRVEGHADDRGADEYNLALGQERANAVVTYLTSAGIGAERVAAISFGEERLACPDQPADEACHRQNRRANFSIVAR